MVGCRQDYVRVGFTRTAAPRDPPISLLALLSPSPPKVQVTKLQQTLNRHTTTLAEHTRLLQDGGAAQNAVLDSVKSEVRAEMNILRQKSEEKFRHQGKQLEWFQRKLDTHKREVRTVSGETDGHQTGGILRGSGAPRVTWTHAEQLWREVCVCVVVSSATN